jgi:DNA transformation protein and related proteins
VDEEDLQSLPDIGRASERWLRAIGVTTVSQLRRMGPAEAFARIAYRFGSAVNRNLLYALAMGLEGRKYNEATPAEKARLCDAAGVPRASGRKSRRSPRSQ